MAMIEKRIGLKRIFQAVGCIACLVLVLAATSGVSADAGNRRVLFISSYSYAWETVPEQIKGIQEALSENVDLEYKFMDTKNSTSEESAQLFYQSLKQYLQEVPAFDALIVGDDAALQFAMAYQEELFHGIPIAFEGVNDISTARQAGQNPLITGVVESLSYQNTITFASKLYPEAKRIVAVLDDTLTGEGERKEFYEYNKVFDHLEFRELNASEMTKGELVSALSSLNNESILLYIMCSEDSEGNNYMGSEGIRLVSSSAKIPTFSMVSIGMGHGFLGGEMVSQRQMGKIAGQMVQDYLDGADFAEIDVELDTPKTFLFDENVMKRFGISESQLPEGRELINHTPTFVEKNIAMIRISAVVIALLLVILCVLLADNLRKRHLGQALENAKFSLSRAAKVDNLTGLSNRSVFMESLRKKIDSGREFALVLYNIDHFKEINGTLGHSSGDIVLKEMALRVKNLADARFSIYRLAGDEFTVLIDDTDREVIVDYLKKIQKVFHEPVLLGEKEYYIHASIGVALYPSDAKNQTDLVAAADKAMYDVKSNGRNAYAFYGEL